MMCILSFVCLIKWFMWLCWSLIIAYTYNKNKFTRSPPPRHGFDFGEKNYFARLAPSPTVVVFLPSYVTGQIIQIVRYLRVKNLYIIWFTMTRAFFFFFRRAKKKKKGIRVRRLRVWYFQNSRAVLGYK